MAKTVSQIMAELDKSGGYAADRQLLQQQLESLPSQSEAQIKGLDAQLARANDNILQGARGRGLGFSGIPIAEQAQYAATEYAPAVAQVRQSQNEAKRGILGSLNSLSRDMRNQAQSIFENNRNYEEQRRQFNEQMRQQREQAARAAAAAAQQASAGDYLASLLSGGGGGQSSSQSAAQARQENIYSRAQSLQKIWQAGDPALFNRSVQALLKKGDRSSKDTIVTAYKLIGHGNAGALKKWGLV